MPTLEETTHAGSFILSEANGNRSRENGILRAGQALAAGTVLGRLMGATVAADDENTGTGTLASVVIGPAVQDGIYTVTCTTAAVAPAVATFSVLAPDGAVLPDAAADTAYTSAQIGFTIAEATGDGAAAFVAGDTFTITVVAGDYEQLDPAEDDGAQSAAAILYAAVDATGADTACAVVVRDAVVNLHELIWPADITADQKAAAVGQLKARGLMAR